MTFPPGVTTRSASITINGNVISEPNETFFVNLSEPLGAVIGDGQGLGTILNDDFPPPTTVDDAYSTPLNTPLNVAAPGVLANDNSNGGGAMTASLVSNVSSGVLTLAANGGFAYTPNAGFAGTDTFTYRAVTSFGNGNVATVTITVEPAPPPTTVNDAYSTPFNTPLSIAAPGVLANDNANGGGAMTAALVSTVSNGVLALAGNGGLAYTPNAGFTGTDTFTYRAVTTSAQGNVGTVTIAVGQPTTVQPPTGLRVVSVVGNSVTLRWEAATLGPAPTDHRIEGGFNPGEVLAGVNTGSPYPVFTFNAPNGAFYIRAHALRPGETSPASNEVRLFVNVSQAPSPPINLLGSGERVLGGANLDQHLRRRRPHVDRVGCRGSWPHSASGADGPVRVPGRAPGDLHLVGPCNQCGRLQRARESGDADGPGPVQRGAARASQLPGVPDWHDGVCDVGSATQWAVADGVSGECNRLVRRQLPDDGPIPQRSGRARDLYRARDLRQCVRHGHDGRADDYCSLNGCVRGGGCGTRVRLVRHVVRDTPHLSHSAHHPLRRPLGDVAAHAHDFENYERLITVIALVGHGREPDVAASRTRWHHASPVLQ